MIGIELLIHADLTDCAGNVDALARGVERDAVVDVRHVDRRHSPAVIRVQRKHPGRLTRHDEQAVIGLIEGQGEVDRGAADGPVPDDRQRLLVDDVDLVLVGDVDEDSPAVLLGLHRLDVIGVELQLPQHLARPGVDLVQPAVLEIDVTAARDDVEMLRRSVVVLGVGAGSEIDTANDPVVAVVHDAGAAVIGDDQTVRAGNQEEGVRRLERRQCLQMLQRLEIEYLHGAVILGGNEELVLADVGEEMVEVAVIARQIGASEGDERLPGRGCDRGGRGHDARQSEAREDEESP